MINLANNIISYCLLLCTSPLWVGWIGWGYNVADEFDLFFSITFIEFLKKSLSLIGHHAQLDLSRHPHGVEETYLSKYVYVSIYCLLQVCIQIFLNIYIILFLYLTVKLLFVKKIAILSEYLTEIIRSVFIYTAWCDHTSVKYHTMRVAMG